MTKLTMEEKQQLIRMALAAREKAYAPYSDFMVGAALRAADESLEDTLTVLGTFRELNAEGAFPAALVRAGLGIEDDDALTDDEWNAWCAEV